MTNSIGSIWQDGTYSADAWAGESEERAIISVNDWQDEELGWRNFNGKLALALEPGDDVNALKEDLHRFDLITVNFPSFADGRGFSQARLLRDTYAYESEIRAVGAYILDQMPMLLRCGVTTFKIESEAVLKGLNESLLPGIAYLYQPALGEAQSASNDQIGRAWTRFGVSPLEVYQSQTQKVA